MANKYKVWVEIEEEDVDGSTEPERVGEPECVGTFNTNDEAIDFVCSIDPMRDLLEEAAGTFGDIGTDEPVSGADTVDWLNDWIPRVRELLT